MGDYFLSPFDLLLTPSCPVIGKYTGMIDGSGHYWMRDISITDIYPHVVLPSLTLSPFCIRPSVTTAAWPLSASLVDPVSKITGSQQL